MCYKGMFGLAVASGLSDHSKWFTLYTLVYMFIPTQIRPLLEAFSHVAITVQRRHSRESCVLPHSVSWYMTTVIKSLWQRIHRHWSFGMVIFLSVQFRRTQHSFSRRKCQNNCCWWEKKTLDDVSYLYVFEGLYEIIVSAENFDDL